MADTKKDGTEKVSKKWRIAIVSIAIAAVFTIIRYGQLHRGSISQLGNPNIASVRQGRLELSTEERRGHIIVPDGYTIEWKLETKDAWLQVFTKEDETDADARPQYPIGWKKDSILKVETDGHCFSWRLDPKPELVAKGTAVATKATLLYVVHPKEDGQYWK